MSARERFSGTEATPIASSRFSRLGAVISFVAPFSVVVAHAGTASIWRDDLTLLRGLAWIGWGSSGCVSALLAQLSFFLPVGSLPFRLALVSAVILGAAGGAIHALVRDLLRREAMQVPLLVEAVATIAALAATLSAAAQREGGTLGGAGVALLLAVIALRVRAGEALAEPSRAIALGFLVGALVAESPCAALAVVASLATAHFFEEPRVRVRSAPWAAVSAVVTAILLFSPAWLRPFAKDSFFDGARAFSALLPPPLAGIKDGVSERLAAEGAVAVGIAGIGLSYGLKARVLRSGVAALAVVLLCDLVATLGEAKWWPRADVAPLHFLASAVLAAGTAIAVYAIATTLLAWRLPMAKGASILLVMTDLTLAVAAAEEASFTIDRSAWRGAEALTDELWEDLPPNAVLLLRSRGAARRMAAARLAQGTRPDVLVVPVPATGDPHVALRLLRTEPALQKVIQDIALEGRPGEEALTILADARPVFVEFDPSWDRRVFSHFVPDRGWLRFLPEPRGASDRKAAFADLRARSDRVVAASLTGGKPDPETGAMLRSRLMDGAVIAALLGDREDATALAARVGEIPGGELFAAELTQKILATKSGPVDAKALLR